MAKSEIERTVQPSIIDRLTDDDPRAGADARVSYMESLRQFKSALQRDLEWLLNTRRTPNPAPEQFEELNNSLYHFGIPDITSLSRDSMDSRVRLRSYVEQTLATFEPRLANVQITIVEAEGESHRRELHFIVEATLRIDPTPEQVRFDTLMHFSSGQVDVTRAADA